MNNVNLIIWGRTFDLPVVFDCYSDEEILPEQKEALEKFRRSKDALDAAKSAVENYCLKLNAKEICEDSIMNILKYVMPYSLYVRRSASSDRYVGLMCKYRFNPEDGLAVLFKNEELYDIGTSDIL